MGFLVEYEIRNICHDWRIPLVEDAAESLGSYSGKNHTGTFGLMASLSFNGNKIITTGGGGMIITNDSEIAKQAKHITTTSKVPHPYEFVHDEIGYNYRMPNLNAAIGCDKLEQLDDFLIKKSQVANKWNIFFRNRGINFVKELDGNKSNNWLNAIILDSLDDRDKFLKLTNDNGVMTRPVWKLMSKLKMYKECQTDGLKNSLWLEERIVNIPSSVPDGIIN